MNTDLQNWCIEAEKSGQSSRRWIDLKQMYIVGNMTEDDLKSDLNRLAENHRLSINYEAISGQHSHPETMVLLASR